MTELADRQELEQKYRNETAREYEARRRSNYLWHAEHSAAEAMLSRVRAAGAATILDIPVGTGRFVSIYKEFGLKVIGLDISEEMLAQAKIACERQHIDDAVLAVGNAFAIDMPDNSVDVALCIRFMQHIDHSGFETVAAELMRVARTHIILGIHLIQDGRHGFSRLMKAFATSPLDTLHRLWGGVVRRVRDRSAPKGASANYMTRTDKEEGCVLSYLRNLGLSIVEEREILTSLNPDKAVSYRFLLLAVPAA